MFGQNWSVFYIVRSLTYHFILSAFVGWLAYSLTLTILSRTGLRGKPAEQTISRLALLVALSCAVLAHIVEDFTINRF